MKTHTPKPWKFEWDDGSLSGIVTAPICGTEAHGVIAETYEDFRLEAHANGILMAAAPDLLAALEGILEWRDAIYLPTARLDAACEAVAKAKGEKE